MLITELEQGSAALAERLGQSRRIVALTGAGLSTECGVPDFRSPGSPWRIHKPIGFAEFLAGAETRREAWRRKFAMDDLYQGVQPGKGHHALVDLARRGLLHRVVTQNIDNLHQVSGLPGDRLVELHGNGSYAACLSCGERHELAPIRERFEREREPASCAICGGIVKSATIAFGQAMPEAALRAAVEAASACDLMLVLGSSLVVQPAARLPLLAAGRGATLVIANREPTPLDEAADLVLRADVGSLLQQAVAKLRPLIEIGKNPL
ncbi:MAG: Sir2 family NAD-dependent protein deacetylase [Alsobacter sp.]